jgi:ribosome biogenesis GTPase / thiamine phosphate phosphatase
VVGVLHVRLPDRLPGGGALTRIDRLSDHPLAPLGWAGGLQADLDVLDDPEVVAARVLAVDRGSALVDSGRESWRAPLAGRLRLAGAPPTTGDFVAAVPGGPVHAVLPRRGVIARRRERGDVQVLAANVDLALLATSPNRELDPGRVARFLSMTAHGSVETVVLLTKADLVPDPEAVAAGLAAGLDGILVLPVSVRDGTGLDALRARLAPRRTAVLLGSSGVGKSTLLNALLGEDRQATAAIRADDDEGRHTTVRRELIPLPGGALLIDTPGLRSVAALEDDDAPVPLVEVPLSNRERRARDRAAHRSPGPEPPARRRGHDPRGRRQG